MTSPAQRRAVIWVKTIAFIAAYILVIGIVHRSLFSTHIKNVLLSVTVAFTAVQFSIIAAIVTVLFISRRLAEIRTGRAARLMPQIREVLARYAAGDAARQPLQILLRRHPLEFEACLADFQHLLKGVEHQRLGELAVETGLVLRWEKRYRSRSVAKRKSAVELLAQVPHSVSLRILARAQSDHDQSIRIQAACAQVRSGSAPEVENAFAFALTQPLLVRALLAEELRPRLALLCSRAIPESLSSGRSGQILAALDMIGAWRLGLALPSLSRLLRDPDPEIRSRAWQVLPFFGDGASAAEQMAQAILDSAECVSTAAAEAAGRMKLHSAVPALTKLLRGERESAALAAARSLAQLGDSGLAVLEAEIISGSASSAGVSLEALEKARIGRSGW